jgi:arsenite methyltransferase
MLARARKNALVSTYARNVTFVESGITSVPSLADKTANCIISNCVINLVPHEHKHLVFEEIWRLLKPGGRVAVSDILAKKELSEGIRTNLSLYVGCVAGASQVGEYEGWLKGVGFKGLWLISSLSLIPFWRALLK